MSLYKHCFIGFFTLAFSFSSDASEWTNQVGFSTDYYHRGLTYGNKPSMLFLSSDYQTNSGMYAGLWLGQHNDDSSFRGNTELDYWVGLVRPLSESVAVDLSMTEYSFPDDWFRDYDWREILLSVHLKQEWTMALGFNRDHFSENDKGYNVELTHRRSLVYFILDLNLGLVSSRGLEDLSLINPTIDSTYQYFEVGLSRQWRRLRPRLSWLGTNQNVASVYGQSFAKNELVFSVNITF